jgi:electron transport complex protein RnfD
MSFQSVVGAWALPSISAITGANVTTGATILEGIISGATPSLSNLDLLLGAGVAGCIGETCKLALIVGGIYLVARKVINGLYPVIFIAVAGLFSVALNGFDFNLFLPSILSGGLILGAIFMATDYTTTPNTTIGNVIYFVTLGLITAGLRKATGMEVVSFAILLMNLFVPLIDKFIINKPFGYKKAKGVK